MISPLWLIPAGFIVGAYGTLIGAGGGFVLMPLLLILYPHEDPTFLTAISLAVVFLNACSGTLAYVRMRRVDFKSGVLFALLAIPGAIFGAKAVGLVSRNVFEMIFGFLMVAVSFFLFLRPPSNNATASLRGQFHREVIERNGITHRFSYNLPLGLLLSFVIGFISSFLGIGGGIIHMPALVYLLNFPFHIATATSHLVLACTSAVGSLVHVQEGILTPAAWQRILYLGIGVLPGAQVGAHLSNVIHSRWVLRFLAAVLCLAGLRILLLAL